MLAVCFSVVAQTIFRRLIIYGSLFWPNYCGNGKIRENYECDVIPVLTGAANGLFEAELLQQPI